MKTFYWNIPIYGKSAYRKLAFGLTGSKFPTLSTFMLFCRTYTVGGDCLIVWLDLIPGNFTYLKSTDDIVVLGKDAAWDSA